MATTSHTDRAAQRPYLDDLAELYDRFIGAMDLDLGCGNGRTCRMIADRYQEVIGVDVSSQVLEIAQAKDNPPNVRYECRDVLDLSPANASTGFGDKRGELNVDLTILNTERKLGAFGVG